MEKSRSRAKTRPPLNRRVIKCSVSPSLSLPPPPIYLCLAVAQSESCSISLDQRAVPRPLNPWHVQVLQRDLTVIRDNSAYQRAGGNAQAVPFSNSPSTRFMIVPAVSMICSYKQSHLPRFALAQRRARNGVAEFTFLFPAQRTSYLFIAIYSNLSVCSGCRGSLLTRPPQTYGHNGRLWAQQIFFYDRVTNIGQYLCRVKLNAFAVTRHKLNLMSEQSQMKNLC